MNYDEFIASKLVSAKPVGSEGMVSVRLGRKFLGTELKASYFRDACGHLRAAEQGAGDLFAA